jgi:hypothetical protein
MDDLERYLSCARADGNIEAMFAFRTAISHLQRKEADSADWWERQGIEALVTPFETVVTRKGEHVLNSGS